MIAVKALANTVLALMGDGSGVVAQGVEGHPNGTETPWAVIRSPEMVVLASIVPMQALIHYTIGGRRFLAVYGGTSEYPEVPKHWAVITTMLCDAAKGERIEDGKATLVAREWATACGNVEER